MSSLAFSHTSRTFLRILAVYRHTFGPLRTFRHQPRSQVHKRGKGREPGIEVSYLLFCHREPGSQYGNQWKIKKDLYGTLSVNQKQLKTGVFKASNSLYLLTRTTENRTRVRPTALARTIDRRLVKKIIIQITIQKNK